MPNSQEIEQFELFCYHFLIVRALFEQKVSRLDYFSVYNVCGLLFFNMRELTKRGRRGRAGATEYC
jgi:hypothetical protein